MKDDSIQFNRIEKFSELKGKHNYLEIDRDSNTLYIVPFWPEVESEIAEPLTRFRFDVGWKDPDFQKILHKEIAPIDQIEKIDLPEGKYHVAVHVRTGGGFDKLFTSITRKGKFFDDITHPLKFPPESFYVENIKKMSELLSDNPMYVHIFSDSSEIAALAKRIEKEVNKPNIEYGYRQSNNSHNTNVLDDMFGLLQFDYLIRPESNFSIIAGKLKVYDITIYPYELSWDSNNLWTIDKAVILIKDKPQDGVPHTCIK
jgi:hypothetical protein